MRRALALTAALMAAAAACLGSGASGAHAQGPSPQGCYGFGRLALTPGVTMQQRQVNFGMTQTIGPCRLSDSSILSGTLTGSGSGPLSCVAGSGSSVFTVRWDNGRTSTGTYTFHTSGTHMLGSGSVTQGEFAGDRFGVGGEIQPRDPNACNAQGVTEARTYESIGIAPS